MNYLTLDVSFSRTAGQQRAYIPGLNHPLLGTLQVGACSKAFNGMRSVVGSKKGSALLNVDG